MIALDMVVLDELGDGVPQVPLTKRHQLAEALGLDGQHELLREGVQVRAVRRELEALDASLTKDRAEGVGEERVAVVDEVAHARPKSRRHRR